MQRPARISPVLGAVVLVGIVRALVAISRFDEVELELYSGSMAWALLNGMPLDPTQLPVVVHLRGSVAFGLLLVPFLALLGPTLAAIKLLAVAWSCLGAALFARLLDQHVGRRAAWVGVALLAFAPPAFQMVDVIALGSHGETIPLWLGCLLFMLGRTRGGPLGRGAAAALGAMIGLGLLFSLQFLAVLPPLAVLWMCLDEKRWRELLPLGGGALVVVAVYAFLVAPRLGGLALWWHLALAGALLLCVGLARTGLRPLAAVGAMTLAAAPIPFLTRSTVVVNRALEDRVLPDGVGGLIEKLAGSFVWHGEHGAGGELRRAWLFHEHGGAWLSWIYGGALLIALVLLAPRLRRLEPLAVFAVLHPLCLFALYAATDFEMNLDQSLDGMGSRYVMPILPSLIAWIAMVVQDHSGRAALLLPAIAGSAGVLGLASLAEPVPGLSLPPVRGTQFHVFHGHLEHAAGPDHPEQQLAWIDRVSPDWPGLRPMLFALQAVPPEAVADPAAWKLELTAARSRGPAVRPYLLVRLSYSAALMRGLGPPHLAAIADLPGPDLEWAMRGVGKGWMVSYLMEGRTLKPGRPYVIDQLSRLPPRLRRPAAEGAGFELGQLLTPYQRRTLDVMGIMDRLPSDLVAPFFQSAGLGYRYGFSEETWDAPAPGDLRVELAVPEAGRGAFREGLGLPTSLFPLLAE